MSKHDARNIRVMPFLEAYEKQESLWNPALESYKNKIARDEAYQKIIKDLNAPTLSINDIKLKVKSIRTTYTKELRILTKHKEEGKYYLPKLFWFNRAHSFLKDVSLSRDRRSLSEKLNSDASTATCVVSYINDIPHRRSIGIHDDDDEVDEHEISDVHHHQHTILNNATTSTANTNHNNSYEYKTLRSSELELQDGGHACVNVHDDEDTSLVGDDEALSVVKSKTEMGSTELQEYCSTAESAVTAAVVTESNGSSSANLLLEQTNNASAAISTYIENKGGGNDEYDHFCRSVAAQLRRITDSYSRAVAKLKIQQILFEAETGHYRNNPTITIPVSQPLSNL